MSRIIRFLKCNSCLTEYSDVYISFGHPKTDFKWKWECEKCGFVNEEEIEAMPWQSSYTGREEKIEDADKT